MGIINVLDFQVANLIAAGEVVDRPASVVKELLENAIDAGADQITVEIKRGGVSFIRITDNGCGMAREDVPVALKRHATSKIKAADDLDTIMTLGFRGEALAAISSVSEMRILTRRAEDEVGTVLEASGGRVTSVSAAGCPEGTTIVVENLFFNTPARLKFLKKDGTEAAGVASYIEKIALSHPEITFRFISDGEIKYITSGDGDRKNCIYAVLGRDFTKKMIPLRGGFDGVNVTGYIGTPENTRGNRNLQIFFINNRYIRSKTVTAALEQAFSTYIPGDKFPCAVMYLEMNPLLVDVNVHPAKLEVKFSNERLIFEAVYYAVRGTLENQLNRPELKMLEKREKEQRESETVHAFTAGKEGRGGEKTPAVRDMRQTLAEGSGEKAVPPMPAERETAQKNDSAKQEAAKTKKTCASAEPVFRTAAGDIPVPYNPPPQTKASPAAEDDSAVISVPPLTGMFDYLKIPPMPNEKTVSATKNPTTDAEQARMPEIQTTAELPQTKETEKPEKKTEIPPYRMVGEVFQCYVILESGDTMYLVDKHAAHERIIFEELKAGAGDAENRIQMLLIPLEVSLSAEEARAAEDFAAEIADTGFAFTLDGKTAALSGIPSFLDTAQAEDAFREACARLADETGTAELTRKIRYEKALFQASCKAAIKAGRNYDEAHLKWICDRVLSDPRVRYCPHGRPVCFEMTKQMVENRFGRT